VIKLGLISFSDGRERVHASLAPDIRAYELKIKHILEQTGELQIEVAHEIAYTPEIARREAQRLADMHLDGTIFNIPVFAFPHYAVIAAQVGRGPYFLLGPQDPRYPGLGGLLGAAGALTQIGLVHERLWGDLDDESVARRILSFARAASATRRLRGQVYGLIGGRSIGMLTGAAPAELWQRQFGVDIDHVDQSEIVRRAGLVPAGEVEAARSWLQKHVRSIEFDGQQLTPEKLDFELCCYIATKGIVADRQFDFIGVKCHFDLSEFFGVQCLSAAFMNDMYDWQGPKPITSLACEADSDGALTMHLMAMISGRPACLLDLRYYDAAKQVYTMPNCGAAPTWYAARSEDPAENLERVRIVPAIKKYAGGGAHVEFVFAAGPVTLARLSRSPRGYQMVILNGETREHPIGDVMGASPGWPHAFVRMGVTPEALVEVMQANHLHLVAGDWRNELVQACRLLNIEPIVL
jgi:L-fucose isomerase